MKISLIKNIRKYVATAVAAVAVAAMTFTTLPCEAATKKPTSMTLKVTTKTIDIKGKSVISVKSVKPSKASKAVTFKTSNKKIATVTSKGVVTGKKSGKVKITATSKANKKLKKIVTITVKNLKPTKLTLSATKATLKTGSTKTLKATVKPTGVYCPVKYTTSNKTVATVSTSGKITAKKSGTATITAKATQKSASGKYLKAACKVTVTAKIPASEAAYKINVQKGEDLYTNWTSMELEPEVVLKAVEDGDMDILDIRFASKVLSSGLDAGYAAGHIKGSIWAPAWPTTTATAQANVRKEAEKIKNSANPTTIVCMAGEEGARRAAAVLIDAGVPKSKLKILRGGGIELVKNYKDRLVTGTEE